MTALSIEVERGELGETELMLANIFENYIVRFVLDFPEPLYLMDPSLATYQGIVLITPNTIMGNRLIAYTLRIYHPYLRHMAEIRIQSSFRELIYCHCPGPFPRDICFALSNMKQLRMLDYLKGIVEALPGQVQIPVDRQLEVMNRFQRPYQLTI